MLKKLLKQLENPKRPLLGPNIKSMKFWGLLLSKNIFRRYFSFFVYFYLSFFAATEYVDIWFTRSNINLVMKNMKISMLATVSFLKFGTFFVWNENWKAVIEYVTRADLLQRTTSDAANKDVITKYTKYCRTITYLYWSLTFTTSVITIFQPVFKYFLSENYRENVQNGTEPYLEVISSWVPFNKNKLPGYLAASAFQSFVTIYGGAWIALLDSNAMVIMVFFRGEIELLRIDSAKIFGTELKPVEENVARDRLKECCRRHSELVKYAKLFDSLLSPTMFLYMFVCSVMLCVTAYQITNETSVIERFLNIEYLVFGIAQLFIYCWHSNEVLYMSRDLMQGPYESIWWTINASKRKDLQILVEKFRQEVVFSTGPFTDLTVATFINILKGAYSYYTLLSNSQIK